MQNLIKNNCCKDLIDLVIASKISFNIGEIIEVEILEGARKPSYKIKLDFGELGEKISCGQLVNYQTIEELLGLQVLCITNFSPIRIAGIKSEVLTLGFPKERNNSQAILITTTNKIKNGLYLSFSNPLEKALYEDFTKLEIKSATIKKIIKENTSENIYYAIVDLGNKNLIKAFIPGKINPDINYIDLQVPIIMNLKSENTKNDNHPIVLSILAIDNSKYSTLVKIFKPVENGLDIF